jgi:Sigma-70 region 2
MCLVTGNRQEAEEIMQDAFLRLWEQWDRVAHLYLLIPSAVHVSFCSSMVLLVPPCSLAATGGG